MAPLHCMLGLVANLLAMVPGIYAQSNQTFEWGFLGPQSFSSSLPSCRSFSLEADATGRIANGVPPFYMMVFPVGGIPSTTFIGTNQSNLTWTLTYPVGTKLVLEVVDSLGQSGGIPSTLYTVIDGETTQCIPTPSTEAPFTIKANVTDVLNTCQPWGLAVEGGTPPYNLTIAPMNSGNITNATFGPDDSVFTWINRAPPGTHLIASASDLNGRWADGSPFVLTQGSSNTDCPGMVSTSSSGTLSENDVTATRISRAHIGMIAGGSVAGLLICAITILAVLRRRRSQGRATDIEPFSEAASTESRHIFSALIPTPYMSRGSSKARSSRTDEMDQSPPPSSRTAVISLPVVTELPPPYPPLGHYAQE